MAHERKADNVDDLGQVDAEAVSMEPLFADVAGDHVVRFWLPAEAEQLVYIDRANFAVQENRSVSQGICIGFLFTTGCRLHAAQFAVSNCRARMILCQNEGFFPC
mmetsp:Transcript_4874/g.5933  ORF Transcript_4874/g.5933 Transcript_4874/m.5933 type:complete len:105 (-) Transcript_4874:1034-1348(-)